MGQIGTPPGRSEATNPVERRLRPGAGYWENQRAARSMQHGRDYSHGLHDYAVKKAAELQQTLREECNRQEIDRTVTADCCSELARELDQAIAEHASLMRQLDRAVLTAAQPASP